MQEHCGSQAGIATIPRGVRAGRHEVLSPIRSYPGDPDRPIHSYPGDPDRTNNSESARPERRLQNVPLRVRALTNVREHAIFRISLARNRS